MGRSTASPRRDPRIDAYIAKSADFARPILAHIRQVVHDACPDVEETMKWSFPHFVYRGENMCAMAAFKEHATFGFWKNSLVVPASKRAAESNAMGTFGRLTSIADLPAARVLAGYVKKAAKLNALGVKAPQFAGRKKRSALRIPASLSAALAENARARATWTGLPPSHRREYIEWITGAKTDATRDRRLATALAWLADGKRFNWKYERKG